MDARFLGDNGDNIDLICIIYTYTLQKESWFETKI